jgi:hypothetical protein
MMTAPTFGVSAEKGEIAVKLTLRTLAMIGGIVGSVIGFIVSMFYSLFHVVGRISGITADESHFFIGMGLAILGVIGALMSPVSGQVGAILMLVAAVGFFFVIGWWAIIPAIFLLPSVWIAFNNRRDERRPATY